MASYPKLTFVGWLVSAWRRRLLAQAELVVPSYPNPQMKRSVYLKALQQCVALVRERNGALGTEQLVRDSLAAQLGGAEVERPLALYGGIAPDGATRARIDIVAEGHGIELKVVRMPRSGNGSPNRSLYDLGQVANDYLKLASAKKLQSAELVVLLHGPLVSDIGQAVLYRELHNRLFVDYETARQYGELRPEAISACADGQRDMRKKQQGNQEDGFRQAMQ